VSLYEFCVELGTVLDLGFFLLRIAMTLHGPTSHKCNEYPTIGCHIGTKYPILHAK
jgi:hypothetical protein